MRISDWSSDVCSSDLHDRCSAAGAQGSEVSPSRLLQDQLVERQVGDRPPEPKILLLQILHAPRLVGLQTAILLAPAIIGLLGDRDPPTRIRCLPAPPHNDLSPTHPPNNLSRLFPLS